MRCCVWRISADGKQLASGGCDRIVNVWDLSPGYAGAKVVQSIENHADWVFGVAFSPDGKRLLTCSRDKTAKVWDLVKKESVFTFPDHQNGVNGVAVKADGKVGYSVGEDSQLRTWNAIGDQGGKQVRASSGHSKGVLKVASHPKQPILVTAGADGTVRIWNADSGASLKTLTGHTDYVFAVAISPDGNLVASGAWNGEVRDLEGRRRDGRQDLQRLAGSTGRPAGTAEEVRWFAACGLGSVIYQLPSFEGMAR